MSQPNFVILYVNNPAQSTPFYNQLLGQTPMDASDNFVLYRLQSGLMLGLWAKDNVEPTVTAAAGSSELVIMAENEQAVNQIHQDWKGKQITIAQAPTSKEFGYTFTALDPDGHRIRVMCSAD